MVEQATEQLNDDTANIVNNGENENTGTHPKEKTYTQSEVEEIIKRRLNRVKAEDAGGRETEQAERERALLEREQTLNARDMINAAQAQLDANNFPPEFVGLLKLDTPETLAESMVILSAILHEYFQPRRLSAFHKSEIPPDKLRYYERSGEWCEAQFSRVEKKDEAKEAEDMLRAAMALGERPDPKDEVSERVRGFRGIRGFKRKT